MRALWPVGVATIIKPTPLFRVRFIDVSWIEIFSLCCFHLRYYFRTCQTEGVKGIFFISSLFNWHGRLQPFVPTQVSLWAFTNERQEGWQLLTYFNYSVLLTYFYTVTYLYMGYDCICHRTVFSFFTLFQFSQFSVFRQFSINHEISSCHETTVSLQDIYLL